MRIALITNYLTGYRMPLYERLAASVGLEVLCFGGGERYVPAWFADLDRQLAQAPFPARRLTSTGALLGLGRSYDGVIAGFAGGSTLFASFAGAKLHRKPFILWASIWAQPRSLAHDLAFPASAFVYRYADSVLAYGPHAERFIEPFRRGEDAGIFIAPQAVEPELFGRDVSAEEVAAFRTTHDLGNRPLVLYSGRFVAEKGVEVLLDAWPEHKRDAILVMAGDGPLASRARSTDGVTVLGPLRRAELPVLYAAAEFTVLASIPTRLFREPWGLVCNESMHQGRPVIATSAVGAAAGGLVRDMETGLVIAPGDATALAGAIDRLLGDEPLRLRLGEAARNAVKAYNYDAMSAAFEAAIRSAIDPARS